MGFTGWDDFINQTTVNKKIAQSLFSKTLYTSATSVAGRWHECLSQLGTGGQMALTGSAGVGVVKTGADAGAIPIGINVSPATKHFINVALSSGSTTIAPAWVMLTDIIHIYPSCVLVGTPTTFSNHPTWTASGDTRMTNAEGVQCSLVVTTATTAAGTILPNYKDTGGSDQAAPRAICAPIAATPIGALYGDTGTAATIGAPFMALAAGDTGVKQLNSYTIPVAGTTGVGCFILHRPIAFMPIVLANLVGERDFASGVPLFPRIYDDACLGMFVQVGGAYAAGGVITGAINYAWGG
jgi:hypothetical protein